MCFRHKKLNPSTSLQPPPPPPVQPFLPLTPLSQLVEVRRQQCTPRLGHAAFDLVRGGCVAELQFADVVGIARDKVDPACDNTTDVLGITSDSRRDVDSGEELCGGVEDSDAVGVIGNEIDLAVGCQDASRVLFRQRRSWTKYR